MKKKRTCIVKMPYGLAAYIAKARVIQNKLSAPQFNAVIPAPATVIANLTQLEEYLAESLTGNHSHKDSSVQLRKETQAMLSSQVSYVNSIADGNVNTLEQSGFELSKVPSSIPAPEQGVVVKVEDKNDGTVIVDIKHLPHCEIYEAQVTGPSGFTKHQISLYSKIKLSDLPVGVRLSVRVRGVNKKGEGDWSIPCNFVSSINPTLENNPNE